MAHATRSCIIVEGKESSWYDKNAVRKMPKLVRQSCFKFSYEVGRMLSYRPRHQQERADVTECCSITVVHKESERVTVPPPRQKVKYSMEARLLTTCISRSAGNNKNMTEQDSTFVTRVIKQKNYRH